MRERTEIVEWNNDLRYQRTSELPLNDKV